MNQSEIEDRREKAIDRYKASLAWYERTKNKARVLYYLFQVLVIVLSGITPLVILATDSKFWQAVLPALASICAGIMGVYQWQDSWMRRAITVEALKSEYAKFDTRSGDDYDQTLTDADVISRFVLKMEDLLAEERSEWHRRVGPKRKPDAG